MIYKPVTTMVVSVVVSIMMVISFRTAAAPASVAPLFSKKDPVNDADANSCFQELACWISPPAISAPSLAISHFSPHFRVSEFSIETKFLEVLMKLSV
jgi:hypothetical protein